ncbi:MAG: hypothetical protein ABSB74_13190 [Tepidisphaeraceae bacterium]
MSEHISDREVREILKRWESLRPTVTHEYSSGIVGTNRSADELDLFKRLSTVLSVAAQERGIDAVGIDALAVEPTTTNPRTLAGAELAIGKLKIMTIQTSAIPAGTYQTYRSMLEHPAIRQARAKLVARIKSADLQSEMAEGATAELQRHAEKLIERLRISFLNDAATMLDYGWVGFEVIFETKNPSLGNVYLQVERLKWLLPDITTILLDKNGIFAGLRNGAAENEQVDVGCSNALCMALRAPGDGREVSYGRSQLENVRHLWGRWKSGADTDNIDQRLHDGYFGSTDPNAGLEQTARDVLDACEIAINELLDRILIWHVGDIGRGKVRLKAILDPAARQPASNRIKTSAVEPQAVEPVRTTFYLEDITAEQLTEVADAAVTLVQGIRRHLARPGECSGPGKVELTDGAQRLERALNPDKLKFDDPQRISIMPRNWPAAVWSDLRDIRHHFDKVITVCDWQDLCDGPNPLRRWEPIPLNGFVSWPENEVDNADLQKIEEASQRLKNFAVASVCDDRAEAIGVAVSGSDAEMPNSVVGNLREPPPQAFAAYRAYRILGQKQADVAAELNVNQGQVSRWVTQVAAWIKAGNVLPNLDVQGLKTKPISVDPAVIDMGERQDGHAKHQRGRTDD